MGDLAGLGAGGLFFWHLSSVTVINHPTGVHGFDIYAQTALSERVIRQVVAFLQQLVL